VRERNHGTRELFDLKGIDAPQPVDPGVGGHNPMADADVSGEVELEPLQVMIVP
jgi:hypothetical protein